jgi:hypothetical protein
MIGVFYGILLVVLPTYLACAVAYVWSLYSASPRLAVILRRSAVFWAIALTLAIVTLTALSFLYAGNWLYGFVDATGGRATTANVFSTISVYTFFFAVIYGALLLLVGGIWEGIVRGRKAPD